ncbi:hypothetical protein PTI98_012941 [Pleurotus ostreatus]|nr:hypothetical protein PTI98_012941 [Pleurotus ostreatus]
MATYSQMSWLDPALLSDEDATPASTPQREVSPPISNERKNPDAPAVLARLNIDDIKRLPDVLFCDIVRGGPGGNQQVARIYMLPERLPCPWPPRGPFAPVTREDLQFVELPVDCDGAVGVADALERVGVDADASESDSDDTANVATEFKWRAFEPQTRSFGAEPLYSTTDLSDAIVLAIGQDAQQGEQSGEEYEGDGDIAAAIPVQAAPRESKRKRSRQDAGTDGKAKRIKRTYAKGFDEDGVRGFLSPGYWLWVLMRTYIERAAV